MPLNDAGRGGGQQQPPKKPIRKLPWVDWYSMNWPERPDKMSDADIEQRLRKLRYPVLQRLGAGVVGGSDVKFIARAVELATKILEEIKTSLLSEGYGGKLPAPTPRQPSQSSSSESEDDLPRGPASTSSQQVDSGDESTTPSDPGPPRNCDVTRERYIQRHLCLHAHPWCPEPTCTYWRLSRATCRFTRPGMALDCESCDDAVKHTLCDYCWTKPIHGHERTALLVLHGQADALVEAVRKAGLASAPLSDSIHTLLADLSDQVVIYCRSMREFRHVETVDGAPAVWVALVKLVEVIDALVPAEDSIAEAPSGGVYLDCTNTAAAKALSRALGYCGFLPRCLECLEDSELIRELGAMGANQFVAEFRVHVLLVLRLVLTWQLPSEVARPECTVVASYGHVMLFRLARDLHKCTDSCNLVQLSLTFDAIRLLLQSSEGVASFCGAGNDATPTLTRKPDSLKGALPVAYPVGDALEHMAAVLHREAPSGMDAAMVSAMVSAVHLFTVVLCVPPSQASDRVDQVAKALRTYLAVVVDSERRLSLELSSAIRNLANCPQQFGHNGEPCKILRESLCDRHIADWLAAAAKGEIDRILREEQASGQTNPPDNEYFADAKTVTGQSAKQLEEARLHLHNAEAVTKALHGDTDTIDDIETLRTAISNFGTQPRLSSLREVLLRKRGCLGVRY